MKNVTHRIEVKPVDHSLESLNSEVIYFLFCQVFWMLKSISITRPISRVICLAVDLQQYKMIYSLVDISLYLYFIRYQVDVSLHLDKTCLNTIPCHTQELYFAK